MRIHRLEIQAFGPFADRVCIDFDELGSQGLFLLNGATGSGKTSILDAICYALYGKVPGTRREGKRLRSDHAAEGVEPVVVCEFSSGDRRLEVTRSPAWDRPAKRGGGTTVQQAQTLLREKTASGWEPKSSRTDEASGEIAALLGMTDEQFTKVVLLAQGDFAAFLRAKADERRELLEKLFGTHVYAQVERQLNEEARTAAAELGRAVAALEDTKSTAAFTVRGVVDAEELETVPTIDGRNYFAELGRLATAVRTSAGHDREKAFAAAQESARHYTEALARRSRHLKYDAAVAAQDGVGRAEPDYRHWLDQRSAHHEAAALRSCVDAAETADAALRSAGTDHEASLAALRAEPLHAALVRGEQPHGSAGRTSSGTDSSDTDDSGTDNWDADRFRAAAKLLGSRIAVVESLLPQETELADRRKDVDRILAEHAAVQSRIDRLEPELARSLRRYREQESAVGELKVAAGQLESRIRDAGMAQARQRAIDEYQLAHEEAAALQMRLLEAREAAVNTKERWLSLRDTRLDLAAGELAARLQDGQPCLVCGSSEHPHPSEDAGAGAQSAQDEERAKAESDRLDEDAAKAHAAQAGAQKRLAVLASQGGDGDAEEAAAALAAAESDLAQAQSAHRELNSRLEQLESLAAANAALQEELDRDRSGLIRLGAEQSSLESAVASLEAALVRARDGFPSLAERLTILRGAAATAERAGSSASALSAASAAAASCADDLIAALPQTPFGTAEEVRAALLTPVALAGLDRQIRSHEEAAVRAAAAMEDPDVVRAAAEQDAEILAEDEDALSMLEAVSAAATSAAEQARDRLLLAQRAVDAVEALAAEYRTAEEQTAPIRERAELLGALADTARGQGDNSYRMALSAYVLAARLEQVAVAASQRLVAMTDGRYTLEHSDAKAARGVRSGLGLEVVDAWTGAHRDTSTLSGGESFMASLSLALGLADVVQQEAGGMDIETLFVDEGFGSLDEQTLEQVMDALEGLRSGGRVVGLVSHVAEMKVRIPAQLLVHKGRHGSTVTMEFAAVPV